MISQFYIFKQDRMIPNSIYIEKYHTLLEVLNNQGVDLGCEPGLIKYRLNTLDPKVNKINDTTRLKLFNARESSREKYTAMAFLLSSDSNRHGKLLEDLENQHTQGFHNVLPSNIVNAYRILNHWHCNAKHISRFMHSVK